MLIFIETLDPKCSYYLTPSTTQRSAWWTCCMIISQCLHILILIHQFYTLNGYNFIYPYMNKAKKEQRKRDHKILQKTFAEAFCIIARTFRKRCCLVGEWLNKQLHMSTVINYSVLKRNEASSHNQWKKPKWRGYVQYNFNTMIFCKSKICEDSKMIHDFQE